MSIYKEPLCEDVSENFTMSSAMRCKFSSVSALDSCPECDASSTVPILSIFFKQIVDIAGSWCFYLKICKY